MAAVKAQSLAGRAVVHASSEMDPAIFDFEICVPVTAQEQLRDVCGRRHARRQGCANHLPRPYEGLGAAWGEFSAWIEANGTCHGVRISTKPT